MLLEEKVNAVEEVFENLDREVRSFQDWSALGCVKGCGKCCFKPDIEASVLEFLPLAYHLYLENKAHDWYERLKETSSSFCLMLNPAQSGAGFCLEYKYRGLICRLFGYSARTNKYGQKELVTCQVIKTEQPAEFAFANEEIKRGGSVPVMNEHYLRLHSIDFDLAREFFPINEAIRRAIEVILHHYAYRS